MKIKFHSTTYKLIDTPNVIPTHFQASIEKEDFTFDSIINDAKNVTTITIFNEDGEVVKTYSKYTKRLAVSVYEDDTISIEFIPAEDLEGDD